MADTSVNNLLSRLTGRTSAEEAASTETTRAKAAASNAYDPTSSARGAVATADMESDVSEPEAQPDARLEELLKRINGLTPSSLPPTQTAPARPIPAAPVAPPGSGEPRWRLAA